MHSSRFVFFFFWLELVLKHLRTHNHNHSLMLPALMWFNVMSSFLEISTGIALPHTILLKDTLSILAADKRPSCSALIFRCFYCNHPFNFCPLRFKAKPQTFFIPVHTHHLHETESSVEEARLRLERRDYGKAHCVYHRLLAELCIASLE